MPISFNQYIDITSSYVATAQTALRKLVLRLATTNSLLPPNSYISSTTLKEVGSYFGEYSEEYYRAEQYLAYVLPQQTNPDEIQFARWTKSATAPMIFCVKSNGTTLADWTSIDDGSFTLTMGGFTYTLSSLDFTAAESLSDVATIIQDAIQSETGGGIMWTSALVSYDAVYGGFLLTGGETGEYNDSIVVSSSSSGTDISIKGLLGWRPEQTLDEETGSWIPGAIWARGSSAQTITEFMELTDAMSTNFGSLAFCWNCEVTLSQAISAATLNQTWNVKYFLLFGVDASTYSSWEDSLNPYQGTGLTYLSLPTTQVGTLTNDSVTITNLQSTTLLKIGQPVSGTNIAEGSMIASILSDTSITISQPATGSGSSTIVFTTMQFPEQFIATAFACINYDTGSNTVINYMYKKYDVMTPSVSDDSLYAVLTNLNINFFGVTQTAGQRISFYQPGVLMGGSEALQDAGLYGNEVWFKDRLSAACMDVFLGNNIVPVSDTGKNMISSAMQTVINQALNNGTIVITKPLTDAQKNKITQLTGDSTAWKTIQTNGYLKTVVIEPYDVDPVKYKAVPTIIYAGADGIRKVEGKDLIV